MTGVFVLYRQILKERKKSDEFRAELSEIRDLLESQIYEATGKLMKTPARWKDVNHLLLSAANLDFYPEKRASRHLSPLLVSNGLSREDTIIEDDQIFVLMPFHAKFKDYYRIIRETCARNGFKCIRGDEDYHSKEIFREILKNIAKSRLVIANIDGRNPNVFYELGIAHALGKDVIMTTQNIDEAPFDLKSKRVLVYGSSKSLAMKLDMQLEMVRSQNDTEPNK